MYIRMLGQGGDSMLSDEVKWLAVTHKSFDHARRGFNDRLAFLGRRIVSLQTSLALLNSPQATPLPAKDNHGRQPYTHPALDGLPGLTHEAKDSVLDKSRLAPIAQRYGLDKVTRWKPKEVCLYPAVITKSIARLTHFRRRISMAPAKKLFLPPPSTPSSALSHSSAAAR
jgi:dsRNA-specific ribonuclease